MNAEGSARTFLRPLATLCFSLISTAAFSADEYRLLKEIPIPGNGGWDYVGSDSANRHIFVSHGPQLEVLDADSYAVVGRIVAPGVDPSKPETLQGQGVRGATAAPDLGRGFTSNGRDGSMTIFDLKTLKVLAVVKVGENPDGYVYDPATRRGFTFSNRTKAGTAVELREATVAGVVPLGGNPKRRRRTERVTYSSTSRTRTSSRRSIRRS